VGFLKTGGKFPAAKGAKVTRKTRKKTEKVKRKLEMKITKNLNTNTKMTKIAGDSDNFGIPFAPFAQPSRLSRT
jgi:hypothetical protein